MVPGYTYVHPNFEALISNHQSELLEARGFKEGTVLVECRSTV